MLAGLVASRLARVAAGVSGGGGGGGAPVLHHHRPLCTHLHAVCADECMCELVLETGVNITALCVCVCVCVTIPVPTNHCS